MSDGGDQLYDKACKQWAVNWLTEHGVIVAVVRDVHFLFEPHYAYSSYTFEHEVQEIIIHFEDRGGVIDSRHIDLEAAPSFGELVQQICKAYDEVRATEERDIG